MNPETRTDTVVLIHGLWMTPLSWEHWVTRYEQRGMRVITPGYPRPAGHGRRRGAPPRPVAAGESRRARDLRPPYRTIAALDTADHHGAFVRRRVRPASSRRRLRLGRCLDRRRRGEGCMGAAVQPDQGGVPGPAQSGQSASCGAHHRARVSLCVHEQPEPRGIEEEPYDRYAVPVSGRILFQGAFANVNPNAPTRYNFANDDRAPLFIAGGNDNILPPAVQREISKGMRRLPRAISAYKLFDGRSHYTCGEAGRRLPTSRSTGRRRLRQGISARVELLVNGPINGYGREPAYSFNNSTGRPIQPGTSILLSLVHEASRARLAGNM